MIASILAVAAIASAAAAAEPGAREVPLLAVDGSVTLAKAGSSANLVPLTLEPGGALVIVTTSSFGPVVTLVLPDGTELGVRNAEARGYAIYTEEPGEREDGPATPFFLSGPGQHTMIGVPETAPGGRYAVKIDCSALAIDTEIRVMTLPSSGAPGTSSAEHLVRAALETSSSTYRVGETVVLTAMLFEGGEPVFAPGTRIEVRIVDRDAPSAPARELVLVDGGPYDMKTGDGLFDAGFVADRPGRFVASMRATGKTRSGAPFSRVAATELRVLAPTARLGRVYDVPVDEDRNGFVDAVEIRAEVDVTRPGRYGVTIVLEASNGAAPSHHAKAMLPAGRGEVAVRFRAGELALLGAEGPLAIRTAMLFDHDDRESPLVHRRDDIGTTRPYALAALDLGDISFTERNRATGIDRDGDGRFEAIRAEVGVRIQVPARYEWHGELQDADGRKMERATGTARLGAGTTTVALEFDAAPVTAACARAPFAIQLFLIYAVDEPGAPRPLPWRSKFEGIPLGRISADQLEGGERCPKALFPELAVTSVTATPGPMPGYFTMSVTVTATSATTRSTKVALYRTADLAASERETLGLWLVPPLAAGESASERRRYEIPRERFAVLAVIEDGGIIAVQSGRRATPASEKGKSWNGVAVSPEALRPPGPPRP